MHMNVWRALWPSAWRRAALALGVCVGAWACSLAVALGPEPAEWTRPEPAPVDLPARPAPKLAALLELVSRLPTSAQLVMIVPAGGVPAVAAGLESPEAAAALAAIPELGKLRAEWGALVKLLGWTSAEAVDRLLGGDCAMVVVPARGQGNEATWALFADVSPTTAARLRSRLAALPREVVAGQPILSIEEGAYLLALAQPAGAGAADRPFRLVATPGAGGAGEALLADLLGSLRATGPARLGKTEAFERLSRIGPAITAMLIAPTLKREGSPQPPEWSAWVCVAVEEKEPHGAAADPGKRSLVTVEVAVRLPDGLPAHDDVVATPDMLASRLPPSAIAAALDFPSRVAHADGPGSGAGTMVLSSLVMPWLKLPWDDRVPEAGEPGTRAVALMPGGASGAHTCVAVRFMPRAAEARGPAAAAQAGAGDAAVAALLGQIERAAPASGKPAAPGAPALAEVLGRLAGLPGTATRSVKIRPGEGTLWARVLGPDTRARWASDADGWWRFELRAGGGGGASDAAAPAAEPRVAEELLGVVQGVIVDGRVIHQPWPERRWLSRGHVRPPELAEALQVPLAKGTPMRSALDSVEWATWDVWLSQRGWVEGRVTASIRAAGQPGAGGGGAGKDENMGTVGGKR